MIAVSLVHGGPSPGFFSKTLFKCLVYGPENVKPVLEDVTDVDVAQTIQTVICNKFHFIYCSRLYFGDKEGLTEYKFCSN